MTNHRMSTNKGRSRAKTAPNPKEEFGVTVRDVWRMLWRSIQLRIAREGIPIGTWFVLRVLWEEEGLTQTELAERVGVNGATTVTALNSMTKQGLVVRVPNKDDKRKTNVFLTDRARALKPLLWPNVVEVNSIALDGLSSEEQNVLLGALFKIRANLEKDLGES